MAECRLEESVVIAVFPDLRDRVIIATLNQDKLFTNVATTPLDVTAQGSGDDFPGTIWVADHIGTKITIYEPSDY